MSFVLLGVGIILVVLNFNAIKKEKSSFSSVFHNKEENMEQFEVKLGEIRREFSETILELQKEIQELKKIDEEHINKKENNIKAKDLEDSNEEVDDKSNLETYNIYKDKIKEEEKSTKSNSIKIDEVSKLLSEGFKAEEIGAKLGIGKGEVILIKELYLK